MDDEAVARRQVTGERIRHKRQQQGISLRSLAKRVNVSAGTMSAIENGHTSVTVERMWDIAAALNVNVSALVSSAFPATESSAAPASDVAEWRDFAPLDVDPVLTGAIAAFVATGYHGASMRTIAENAGISAPGVYHHYASKQELLVQILDLTMDELDARLNAARAEGEGPLERLSLIVEALALFHTLRADLAFIGASEMRSLEQPDRDRIAARRTGLQRAIDIEIDAALTAGLIATVMPRETGRAIATMCTSLPQWFSPEGSTTPQQIAKEYAQLAVRMVGASSVA